MQHYPHPLYSFDSKVSMTNSNNSSRSGGIGFMGALGLLFIGLKLGHVIRWPWWAVTLPLWGGLALFLAGAIVVVLIALVSSSSRRAR
jgi:hypothetical protein